MLEGKQINLATLLNNQENEQDYKTVDETDGSVLLINVRDCHIKETCLLVYKNF